MSCPLAPFAAAQPAGSRAVTSSITDDAADHDRLRQPGDKTETWMTRTFAPPPVGARRQYAQQAYLEYALSVVKGRALPDTRRPKPVQRRILYSMQRMGLGWAATAAPSPSRAPRGGRCLRQFHPTVTSRSTTRLVRMAQDFAQRYPLIDGRQLRQPRRRWRRGDALHRGAPGADRPPAARRNRRRHGGLPRQLRRFHPGAHRPAGAHALRAANGASGIAVGLATEVPSHNLREVAAAAAVALIRRKLSDDELFAAAAGPDFLAAVR